MIYLNREAQLGLWEFIHAHDSMIDEVRGNNYYSEPIAFELDDSDIKETIRPYTMGRIIDIRQFFAKYACDPDEPSVCIRFCIEDDLLAWNNGYFTYLFDNGRCIETEHQVQRNIREQHGKCQQNTEHGTRSTDRNQIVQ